MKEGGTSAQPIQEERRSSGGAWWLGGLGLMFIIAAARMEENSKAPQPENPSAERCKVLKSDIISAIRRAEYNGATIQFDCK